MRSTLFRQHETYVAHSCKRKAFTLVPSIHPKASLERCLVEVLQQNTEWYGDPTASKAFNDENNLVYTKLGFTPVDETDQNLKLRVD